MVAWAPIADPDKDKEKGLMIYADSYHSFTGVIMWRFELDELSKLNGSVPEFSWRKAPQQMVYDDKTKTWLQDHRPGPGYHTHIKKIA